MLRSKFIYIIFAILLSQVKGLSCEIPVDSIKIQDGKLSLYFSNGKIVKLKLKYRNGSLQAKYKGNSFVIKFNTVYKNPYAENLLNELKRLREYTYKEHMVEAIGYILYDTESNLYFMGLFDNYKDKTTNFDVGKYKFSKLCLTRKNIKKMYITIVLAD